MSDIFRVLRERMMTSAGKTRRAAMRRYREILLGDGAAPGLADELGGLLAILSLTVAEAERDRVTLRRAAELERIAGELPRWRAEARDVEDAIVRYKTEHSPRRRQIKVASFHYRFYEEWPGDEMGGLVTRAQRVHESIAIAEQAARDLAALRAGNPGLLE
jgi:hypothetical protein